MKPLTVLAGWMSDHQSLNAPQAVFDEFPGAQDLLISEGLIIQSRGHVHFFHESFFDYLYARAFVVGTQSLVGLLTSNNTEQHLFRRTQTRQILETLRQNDPGRYLRELASVLKSDAIRYHIKAAVAQWLGALSDPTEQERDIVLQLDDDNAAYLPLVRYALMASVGWFDRLYKGGWVRSVLHGANDERRRSVLRWLSNIARERPTEVADLLESWWEHDPERGIHLLDWFGSVGRQNQDQRLIALCEKVIRSRPLGLLEDNGQRRREMFLATWTETNSEEGVGILQALFDTWFDAHPGHHPFERDALHDQDLYTLGQVAEKTPRAFIMGTIDALIRSIDEIKRREAAGERDYSFEHRTFSGHRFGADKFLGFFRSALQQAASDAPDAADEFLSRLDVSKHEVLLHLHLEVVSANGEAFAGHLLELLDNTYLFQAGWDGADWKSFADAARATFPYLDADARGRVEEMIFQHYPEIDFAIEIADEVKEHGEADFWSNRHSLIQRLNQSGYEQWCVLETIGETLLSDAGVRRLNRLRRKFPGNVLPKPNHMEARYVSSPIQRDKIVHMTDEQWLRAIARYDVDGEQRTFRSLSGGARQLAGELQFVSKENPTRFVALMKCIPNDAHQTYVSHIVQGLAEAEEVEEELLKEAIVDAHDRPDRPFGNDIARIFERYPRIATEPSIFDVLAWYVEHGDANEDETIDASNVEREIVSIDDLVNHGTLRLRGINGARGLAAEAMAAVLWHVPQVVERTWELLDRRIVHEPLISVRCSLMRPLVPLFNHDRLRCVQFVERLVEGPSQVGEDRSQERQSVFLSPLITHQGTYLLTYLLHWTPDIGRRLLDRLLDSGDETMRMIGAWHVFCCSFQDTTYASEADQLIEEGHVYRRLAAEVASKAITHEEYPERAESQLGCFFNDEDEQVRRQATNVFREIESDDLARFTNLAEAFLASRAFETDAFSFLQALERSTSNVQTLVVLAAEKMVANLEAHGRTGDLDLHLHQLQGLMAREYTASENTPALRKRLLDVIDIMVENELYGTDEILKRHERE